MAFFLLSLALLLLAAGLSGWLWSLRRQQAAAVRRHLDRRFDRRPPTAPGPAQGNAAAPAALAAPAPAAPPGVWKPPAWLLGTVSPRGVALLAAAALAVLALVGMRLGLAALCAAMLLLAAGTGFVLWLRVQKKRERLTQQLPGFLDLMVRQIAIGNAIQAAFMFAAEEAPRPLKDILAPVNVMTRAGVPLEQALADAARNVRMESLGFLAAMLGLGMRTGGPAGMLLERMSSFMRDQEQARQELTALSAETRLSAWVLGLLPLAVGGVIIMTNAGYFMRLWSDPMGRHLVFVAAGLQLLGCCWLYRLARSI